MACFTAGNDSANIFLPFLKGLRLIKLVFRYKDTDYYPKVYTLFSVDHMDLNLTKFSCTHAIKLMMHLKVLMNRDTFYTYTCNIYYNFLRDSSL